MAILQDLPVEILALIIDEPSQQSRTMALASSSLCCRQIHHLVDQILYDSASILDSQTIALFLRTVIERPDLCKHIQSVGPRE